MKYRKNHCEATHRAFIYLTQEQYYFITTIGR